MFWIVHITGPGEQEEVFIFDEDGLEDLLGTRQANPSIESIKKAADEDLTYRDQEVGEVIKIEAWTGSVNRLPIGYALRKQQ